jgi:hypothetical protein
MRHSQTKIVTRALVVTFAMVLAGGAHAALTGGKTTTTTSGGTSSSGSGTTSSSCIGTPTGGKYSSASYSGSSGCTTEAPGTDSDGDSMLDTWEMTYTLNKYDSTDRYGDLDGDGCTNACEHARGVDPTSIDSDGDGVPDMDDPEPNNPAVSTRSLNSTYKGGKTTSSQLAE